MTQPLKPQAEKLNLTTKIAFGAGDIGPALTANVLVFFLLYFFTQVAGLPPGLAGSILMIGKIADAVNDPVVGMMSDRTRTKWGRRIPWMLWGTLPFVIVFFGQWLVPHFSDVDAINDWFLFGYYVVMGILFNLAYTAVNLPYAALTPELTQDYNERTSLNSFRFSFSIGSSIFSLIVARIVFQAYPDNPAKQYWILGLVCSIFALLTLLWCTLRLQEKGREAIFNNAQRIALGYILAGLSGLSVLGVIVLQWLQVGFVWIFVAIALAILLGVSAFTFIQSPTEEHLLVAHPSHDDGEAPVPFKEQLKIAFNNKPFLYVIGIYLASWLAIQLTASILPYFVISWMGLPDAMFPNAALAVQGTALILLFVASAFSKKVGKKKVYFAGVSIWILAQVGLFFLQPGQVGLMFFFAVMAGCGVAVSYLIPWSMVPDVIELDELNTGKRREGVFYGFMVLLQKMGLAISLFLVGQALSWAGFVESVAGETPPIQPDSALFAIRVAIAPLPTLALIIGLVLAYFYPITKEYHEEIRLKLTERNNKQIVDS
ncbi:putative sodium/sugar (melibiose) symporter [[Leptolyngbya] sp. PCC 7376]|uniref:MFS transporter n=1 Tax=[Leptolyngbya] sp. PCC 7376 TaxID=111781 RepID=UPI00029F1DF1|nr:MFS transporter [[Leptolyngbya] sp. PCC 7376]AFY38617.1 putative sodium/sugar (melibiose) symporter [[Leptolyngbya] sp. PCC 7376]